MRIVLRISAALTATLLLASPAAAQMLNFDDLMDFPRASVYVPQLYEGFTFGGGSTGCGVAQCSWLTNLGRWNSQFPQSVSSPVSVWANNATSLTISRSTEFNFQSAYLGVRYGNCPTASPVTVRGFLGAVQTNVLGLSVSCNVFQQYNFNFNNVDRIQFDETASLSNLMLDNLSFSAATTTVPEPTTFALMALGAIVVGGATSARKRS
jgi:hypothetical protein